MMRDGQLAVCIFAAMLLALTGAVAAQFWPDRHAGPPAIPEAVLGKPILSEGGVGVGVSQGGRIGIEVSPGIVLDENGVSPCVALCD